MNDSAEVAHASLTSVISEEPQEFRHATSLDNALQHLIPTLQSHKGDLDLFFMLGCSFQEPCTSPALASSASLVRVDRRNYTRHFIVHAVYVLNEDRRRNNS